MKLHKLSLKDKDKFSLYLNLRPHELAVYAFSNIYIWVRLYDIYWAEIEESLCVFFKDRLGCFMNFAPLAKFLKPGAVKECFKIMDGFNKHSFISRIENIEASDVARFGDLGYEIREKFSDYLCSREDLADLSGEDFRHKRSAYNYFLKHNRFEYLPYATPDKNACLELYHAWAYARKKENPEPVYQGMIEDSRTCLNTLLENYGELDLFGRIVKIDARLKAFSFGYEVSPQIFCILFEITDLRVKGLAGFIFRQFCREASNHKFINIMDDSGLEGLRRVKLSWRPAKLVKSFIAVR